MVLACGPLTIAMYSLNAETIHITEEMMIAYAVIVFFQCIQSVMTKGVLRGGGDTKFLMKADILFMWLVSIPLGGIGGLILGSNLPVKLWELFVIFLERTIISLLIVCPLAHLIF